MIGYGLRENEKPYQINGRTVTEILEKAESAGYRSVRLMLEVGIDRLIRIPSHGWVSL